MYLSQAQPWCVCEILDLFPFKPLKIMELVEQKSLLPLIQTAH